VLQFESRKIQRSVLCGWLGTTPEEFATRRKALFTSWRL